MLGILVGISGSGAKWITSGLGLPEGSRANTRNPAYGAGGLTACILNGPVGALTSTAGRSVLPPLT